MAPVRSSRKKSSLVQSRRYENVLRRAQLHSRAVRNGTTIRLAVQANPDQAPLNVELLIVTHPETGGPAIQLVKPVIRKRRSHAGGSERPVKRRRVGDYSLPIDPGSTEVNPRNDSVPVPVSNRSQQLLYVRNVNKEQYQGQDESEEEEDDDADGGQYADEQHSSYKRTLASRFADEDQERQQDEEDEEQDQDQDSYETHPVPRYVVDLGIVKAFSEEPDFVVPSLSHASLSRYREMSTKRLVTILTYTAVIAAVIVSFVVPYVSITSFLSPTPSMSPVDWFSRDAQIEISYAGIPRVLWFGETSQEYPRWRCQPGMRPPGGHSHLEPDEDDDDVPWSDYRPWVSTSNGSYVSESPFLDDFFTVLGSALRSLRDVANHGPDTFLFSSGSSTQVRWSTSADEFAPPHDSLPTFSVDDTDSRNPGPTVTGIGDQPTPTARPANVWDIYNVDPGLTKLAKDARRAHKKVWLLHSRTHHDFTSIHLNEPFYVANYMLRDLKRLQEDDINRGCLDGRAETVTLARDASILESIEEEMPVVTEILSVAPQEHIYNILGRVREREQQWNQDDSSKPQSTTIRCVPTPPINGFTSINYTRHVTSSST